MNVKDLGSLLPRDALVAWIRATFPHIPSHDAAVSTTRGGRSAGLLALHEIKPQAYERSRNFLTGKVTRLSPYIRHGVLTLAEVRDQALAQAHDQEDAGKLINELAWRDYWQRIYAQIGDGVWRDREAYKTGFSASQYASKLPDAVAECTTGLACIDDFSHQLKATGYLHNHARMWMASYLLHYLRIRWQAGARWFLEHLLDGDPASNNLSWQWVASTFSTKPYIFNRENLERYSGGVYCRECPHATAKTCPFDASYEELSSRLFPRMGDSTSGFATVALPAPTQKQADQKPEMAIGKALIWIHTDGLNSNFEAFAAHPDSAAVFVWDREWAETERISLKRLVFLAECLAEMPPHVEICVGDMAANLLEAANRSGATHVIAQRTPDPRLQAAATTISRHLPVIWVDPPEFVSGSREFDLKRFSRYWQRAQPSAMQPTRA